MFDRQSYLAVVVEVRRHVSSPMLCKPYKRELRDNIKENELKSLLRQPALVPMAKTHLCMMRAEFPLGGILVLRRKTRLNEDKFLVFYKGLKRKPGSWMKVVR